MSTPESQNTTDASSTPDGRVGSGPLFGVWTPITKLLPSEGDIIACCAEHHKGGPMYWAGRVVETRQGFAVMETLAEDARRFIITHDTLWLRLPPPPNTKMTHADFPDARLPDVRS